MCLLHFGMGALLGLSVDEAHYALYAAHLSWSYFDHPPLVGWVQWPLVALGAPTAVLRLVPALLWLGTMLVVYRLATRLHSAVNPDAVVDAETRQRGAQAGLWAVLALSLAPLVHVLGIGLLPDTLLVFFTVALMDVTLTLMDKVAVQRRANWVLLGVLLGLAGLSKYTAIVAALVVAVCLLMAHGGVLLKNRHAWLAIVIAVLLVMPVAWWNYQNHWISFTYQAEHGTGGGWQAVHFLRFLLVQVLAYGPLLFWAGAGVRQTVGADRRRLVLFFALPFALFAALSGGGTGLPHWTAPAWVALAPFSGLGLAHALRQGRRAAIGVFVVLQALACAGVLGLMLTAGVPVVSGAQGQGSLEAPSNPFADLYGWDAAGQRARALAAQNHLDSVSVQNWTLASRLGWYARPLPVHVLEDRFDQFDLWAGDLPVGGSTLLVDWSQLAYAVPLGAHGFADCALLDTHAVSRLAVPISTFRFYACHRWSGAPQPRLQGAAP